MFQGIGLPLARACCVSAPRGGHFGAASSLAYQQQHRRSTTLTKARATVSSSRGVARRSGGRLCMSSEATSPAAAKVAPAKMEEEEVDPGEVAGLRILKYPHPALRAENEEIVEFDDDVKKLARDMFKLMYAAKGVGLAAPQVGVNKRLMVFNPEGDVKNWLDEATLVNPKIVASGKGKITAEEGCLSFPGMGGMVERQNWVKVEAVNAKGKKIKKKYTGWTARIFQHEYDHLQGTVYIDHLSPLEREKVRAKQKLTTYLRSTYTKYMSDQSHDRSACPSELLLW
ncbi:unnamed protein product [Pylaiella littoralis]